MYGFCRVHAGGAYCRVEAGEGADAEGHRNASTEGLDGYVNEPSLASRVSVRDSCAQRHPQDAAEK